MKIHIIDTGYFKLDGGAMFGVVPKKIWGKLNPSDDNNMCSWSMRCMLVEHQGRKILFDTGMGNKQNAKFRSYFEPFGDDTLVGSLAEKGFQPDDITDVVLTHLHFDHCGGALYYDKKGNIQPTFPKATYWTNELHYNWAFNPNDRERASFLKENFVPLKDMGMLQFIDVADEVTFMPGIRMRYSYGHTEAMFVTYLDDGDQTYVYPADLMPAKYHIPMPYVMAYDVRPLQTLAEKEPFLEEALDDSQIIIFEHDPDTIAGTLKRNEKGRIVFDESVIL